MTKKIHVLADETLCGTLREYVEVNRRAEVGESVYTIISEEFRKVTRVEGVGAYLDDGGLVFHENYRVLEPTDIVLIDGNKYRLVDRKAEVGERVIIIEPKHTRTINGYSFGDISEVDFVYSESVSSGELMFWHEEYRVLVPIEAPHSTDDIIANLARRVAELERENEDVGEQLRILRGMRVSRENMRYIHERIDGVKDDIETWAQEHEKSKRELDDKIEMCIDDIVTLDERTSTTEECTEHVNTRRCCGCQK